VGATAVASVAIAVVCALPAKLINAKAIIKEAPKSFVDIFFIIK
jgi:hypothetical protein